MRKGKSFTTALLIVYKNFSTMKNDELGAFLQRRGIPFHGRRKKERIIIAQAAKNLAFPPRPTPEELRTSVVNDKENLLGIENGIIKLPDPEKLLLGWQSKLDNLPNISSVEVIAYIDQRLKLFSMNADAERAKALKAGESLLLSDHVRNVEMHRISPNLKYCFIRAVVNPAILELRILTVSLVLHKETSKVEAAYCACS